jgi:hypothetical protein
MNPFEPDCRCYLSIRLLAGQYPHNASIHKWTGCAKLSGRKQSPAWEMK